MSETVEERRPKRQKREGSKAKLFEKFKELKCGSRNKYEVEELDSVYETVDEKEYIKLVLDRQDDDWIVDDDGSGYVEDGRDIFDDDLDSQTIAQARARKGAKKRKNISENAGKGNLKYMLSNMATSKKKEEVKIEDDDMLSDLLEELDDPGSSNMKIKPKPLAFMPRKQEAQDYLKKFTCQKGKINIPLKHHIVNSTSKFINNDEQVSTTLVQSKEESLKPKSPTPSCETLTKDSIEIETSQNFTTFHSPEDLTINDFSQDSFEDELDISQIEDIESQAVVHNSENQKSEPLTIELNLSEWTQNSINETAMDIESSIQYTNNIPLVSENNKEVFRFFWLDAYEDPEKQKGTVFLFGKTYCDKAKCFVSCCVAVRNIYRQVFVLPRPFKLDNVGQETDQPVTYKDLYMEFSCAVMTPMSVNSFKTRYVTKKYSFDPSIPVESDYMEVQYPATDPKINIDDLSKPKTFSKIFGINSSCLERLLLTRKIKGPCWLDISDPIQVQNPLSWCRYEVNCPSIVKVEKSECSLPPPPLIVSALNFRYCLNPKTMQNEIVMLSCVTQSKYAVDKQPPNPTFNQHFCVFSAPCCQPLPLNIHEALKNYKGTKLQKMDSEKALINYFITQFSKLDSDVVVGHDIYGYHMNMLANRLIKNNITTFNKLGRLKRSEKKKLERELFLGRLVCDIKISAKELIKSRTYDLDALCQQVLKIPENQRIDIEFDEIPKMYQNADNILRLINFTMQDTAYVLKIMYDLNIIPLALQITNIAGNVMSKTLLGGRSERNEYLLLHAFTEKDYIVPDKQYNKKNDAVETKHSKKKPTYSGGLVLDPKVGFYDKLVLLMDFNSLYPSIIQEYNICFTTLPIIDDENLALPDKDLPSGILPIEIRKLVDSRRQVKSLMINPDLSPELRMQYQIRQMALKLTANSMYGCLGFSNSRFYAKNLAALVTQKGREILTNTKELVEKMCFEVVYGDTDSIMINTNILDYDQVFKIGNKIKQEVNKLYKQVELDIDGVFKYLLLLKKKKYAAVTLIKTKTGQLKEEKEYKGLDIVRRDWSQLASETGKFVLEHILSDQSQDDRISNIHNYLVKIKQDMEEGKVPLPLLVITKQLTKDPNMYTDKNSLPHVQVALRYNKEHGGHLRAGDTVPYVICEDGSGKAATQRAYHIEELKTSETLKVDVNYYLSQQIHPVVTRICEPIDGTDSYEIAQCLGLDLASFKKPNPTIQGIGENVTKPEVKFRNVDKFVFKCFCCKCDNVVSGPMNGNTPVLETCSNTDCNCRPVDYIHFIQNQLNLSISSYIARYFQNKLICEDPACPNETNRTPLRFVEKYPVCTLCQKGIMFREYTEKMLYYQLSYFLYIFDPAKHARVLLHEQIDYGYRLLRESVEKYLNHSGYSVINLSELLGFLLGPKKENKNSYSEVSFASMEETDLGTSE
ncbi:DNA polymerase alpha catalytic subunit isoform X2 [Cylas formicarius]|uniref:DNA polymerase alpha catalytic subunit isoform X2 n=1 Tax=Cylas formicarius TaxID=197179 RepID=UPI002958B01A|nr:DNA polymerase alpha catalytic subunit isoform X2 [Cylas formicarius]